MTERRRLDNGLAARSYTAVGDVDPRVGEHLLDVLFLAGIAAYLAPTTDTDPVTRTTALPSRPTDRLYVDGEHVADARAYLDQLAAAGPASGELTDLEERWQGIVADFHGPAAQPDRELPGVAAADAPRPGTDLTPARHPDADEPTLLDALDTFGTDLPGDTDRSSDPDLSSGTAAEDEHYTPPPPPPLPRISGQSVLAVLLIGAGILLLFWPTLLPVTDAGAMLSSVVLILGGMALLIWRLRADRDPDEEEDDGAVV